ncbi:acetyl-CoA synthetase-like protein [Aspergillus sclerotioniger CBS 115572]|uniref:Acetyl-CoA synthetase-like protein n=1 Tax=Aspergillus sclerotioniger CBS 115572 TaxID=1450535 RepID=A0A317V4G3_9EURO|nr:acetyl-CoA synthetase-like protein [Aspergillus sclerotioniger CBS 115572]PWY67968.1 acetyl-CoA synthetase-like protein [Aspergillus sclerotioniger CBS 115572]
MDHHFSQHAATNPDAIAIDDETRQWSYSDLDHEVQQVTNVLKKLDLPPEEPICILEGVGSDTIIAQLAIIRAGLTCVPIEPSIPPIRLMSLLKDVGVRYIMSNQSPDLEDDVVIIPISGEYDPKNIPSKSKTNGVNGAQVNGSNNQTRGYRSHILYTSGSSGKPKAVQIAETSILHIAFETAATPLESSDRVAVVNNPGFDISLFEIFVPLVAGSTLVIVPRSTIMDPFDARDFLARKNVSILVLTASLLSIIAQVCPTAFGGIKHLFSAGEAPNPSSIKAILESNNSPQHVWNTYGPTEATTLSTMHEITPKDLQYENISIGKPFGDTILQLFDEHSNPITKPGVIGEILLGGPGLTAGYIARPKENEEHFTTDKAGSRLYRTGDFARWRPDAPDLLEFMGRADLQVKQGGFRVELGEIEQLFLSSGQLVGATVVQIQPDTPEDEPFLVAFLIPAVANTVRRRQMLEYIQPRVPNYSIPRDIVVCSDYPLTEHGKVDRKALTKQYQDQHPQSHSNDTSPSNDTTTTLKNIWTSILGQHDIADSDDFFSTHRGSSLQAATLISKIQQELRKTISMRSLYENSRLSDLVACLDEYTEGGNAPDDRTHWLQDATLANDLHPVPDWLAPDEGRIFLTGATGFVGAHFLARFLQMPSIKEIVCLTRSKPNQPPPSERIQSVLQRYNLWSASSPTINKLTVLTGDITSPQFGLSSESFTWLTNWSSIVFHLAAKVNFCEPYAAHQPSNVLGTRHALEVAIRGRRKPFIHMSSIDTWGPSGLVLGTKTLLEDDPLDPHLRGLPFDIGYAASKWVAEKLVRGVRTRGVPAMIFRPGFTIGDSVTGSGNPDDFFARLIIGSIMLGAFPHLPNQRLEYVTIDYVCDATIHIASNNANLGRSYSLVAPDPKDSVNLDDTHKVINEAGYPVKLLPYWEWAKQDNPLLGPVLGRLSRFETSRNTPHYDARNTGVGYVSFDAAMLKRFVEFWEKKGFYKV